eukprot:GEZU01011683.1.p3 GENE.GEZU01011683.1~~GEZU01011683.1.p3  ORF type:complete len:123 (-),score=20.81 GEZU01011683.1:185-553(-)
MQIHKLLDLVIAFAIIIIILVVPVLVSRQDFGGGSGRAQVVPPPEYQQNCQSDADCIPWPVCHPRYCFNSAYKNKPKVPMPPEYCSDLFDCGAAYSAKDCACNIDSHQCYNKWANSTCEDRE